MMKGWDYWPTPTVNPLKSNDDTAPSGNYYLSMENKPSWRNLGEF
jgi:hypothetical protein